MWRGCLCAFSAMSTFSPVGSQCSNGMKMCMCVCEGALGCVCVSVCVCVYVCVCARAHAHTHACTWNELQVCTTLAFTNQLFRTMPVLYTSTHMHMSSNHLGTANQQG